jgi:glycerol uptake facilitator-like aquaporin
MDTGLTSAPTPAARPAVPEPSWCQVAWQSAGEFLLTAVLLFGVVSIVRWVIGPSPVSRAVPGIHVKLLIAGLAVGLLVTRLILTRLGKATGGHMNPAITLGMWLLGVFPRRAVLPYVAAQLAGSLLGVLIARGAWGTAVTSPRVAYAALRPAPGWSNAVLFPVEAASMAVIVLLVGLFLAARTLTRFVPWLVGTLIAAAIIGLGTVTGGSVNPARELGPAVFAGQFGFLVSYLLAPLAGAAVAAWLIRVIHGRTVLPTTCPAGTGMALTELCPARNGSGRSSGPTVARCCWSASRPGGRDDLHGAQLPGRLAPGRAARDRRGARPGAVACGRSASPATDSQARIISPQPGRSRFDR